jgi:two-component system response regulator RegA
MTQTRPSSVLLVDGERSARDALALRFGAAGWLVATADGCAQALRSSSGIAPDLLVVDRNLCDGSGFSLFEHLRVVNPDLAAVMVTSQPSIADAVRAIRAGFRDYRSKSLDCSDLPGVFGQGVRETVRLPDHPVAVENPGSLARVEWNHIQRVLLQSRGNVTEAARLLGLHRRSLQRKLRRARDERSPRTTASAPGRVDDVRGQDT